MTDMDHLKEYLNGTYLLKVPFENIDTAVWILKNGREVFLIDCATTALDVEKYILPALKVLHASEKDPITLLLSHSHKDHAGGAMTLVNALPNLAVYAAAPSRYSFSVKAIQNGEKMGGFLEVLPLGGHSADACAFFDCRNNALFTGDTLQLSGISRFGTGISDSPKRYINAHLALFQKDAEHLFASHDYVPLGREVHGKEAVRRYITGSLLIFRQLIADTVSHAGVSSSLGLAAALTEKRKSLDASHPPVPVFTVERILAEGGETLLQKCDEVLRMLSM